MASSVKHIFERGRSLCNNERKVDSSLENVAGPCRDCANIVDGLIKAAAVPEGDDLDSKMYIDESRDLVEACRVTLSKENVDFLDLWLDAMGSGGMASPTRPLYLVQTQWKIKHAREGDYIVRYRENLFDVWRPQRFQRRYQEL